MYRTALVVLLASFAVAAAARAGDARDARQFGRAPVPSLPPVSADVKAVVEELAAAPLPAELRQAAVRCEGLRRHPELLHHDDPAAAARRGVLLVLTTLLALAGLPGEAAVTTVRDILRQAWRASSLVENVNSVVRMQQARHRNLTQGLLNLKRLYWNCRPFTAGRRKNQSPRSTSSPA